MSTYLTLDCALRLETDPSVIANLTRKGWTETVPPTYDPVAEQPPVWENCGWVVRPSPPKTPYRVSKDTITYRVMEAGKTADLINLISALTVEQQFYWSNFAWFWSNNQTVISMCQQLGLDANVILAEDPYL
jgi:hypothetical protein